MNSTEINVSALGDIVQVIIDLLIIFLLTWGGWEALVNRNMAGAIKRAITAIAIILVFNPLFNTIFSNSEVPTPQSNAQVLYDTALGPLNKQINPIVAGIAPNSPGLGLISKGLTLSNAIWSGLVSFKLLAFPIAFCVVFWAVDIAKGGSWLGVGAKIFWWIFLFTIIAGPVTATFPMYMLNTAANLMSSVIQQLAPSTSATPPVPIAPTWDENNISLARSNAQCPIGLDGLVAPYIGSCNRTLPQAALTQLKAANYVGEAASGIVSNMYYTDPTGEATDPKSALQLATPFTNSYQLLFVNTNPSAWITNHFQSADGTILNGFGTTVGFIKIGSNADASPAITTAYLTAKKNSSDQIKNDIIQLQSTNASPIAIQQKQNLLEAISQYSAPNVVPVSTVPAITIIQNYIRNYYTTIDDSKAKSVISSINSTDKDAWGILWLNSNGTKAMTSYLGSANNPSMNMSNPITSWAFSPNIQSAIMRDESGAATPSHEFSIWQLGAFIKGLFTMLFMSIAETGMAFLVLILKLIVYVLAPIISYAALYLLALGIFVLSFSYPCAAYISLFPGRESILLDWTKGVFWVMVWAPIMTAGIMMCSFNASDLGTTAMAVLKAIPGIGILAATTATTATTAIAGSNNIMSTGLVTDSFMQTIVGILLICASPLIANVIFNPGLGGIAGLTSALVKNIGGQVVGASMAPLSAVGGGLVAGAKAAAGGPGKMVAQSAENLNRGAPALGTASSAFESSGGGMMSDAKAGTLNRVQSTLGGGASRISNAATTATASLRKVENSDWAASVGSKATGALQKVAGNIGSEGSSLRTVAEGAAALGGRAVTGAAAAMTSISQSTNIQGRQQQAAWRAMVNPTGLTPATARGAQAASAAMGGDLETAQSLAQGKGEHMSDLDYRKGLGSAGPPGPQVGRQRSSDGAGVGGGTSAGTTAPIGELPSQGVPSPASSSGAWGVALTGESKAAARSTKHRLEAGAMAPPEKQRELEGKSFQAAARAIGAQQEGRLHDAVGSSIDAMNYAIDSGSPGQAARAAHLYETLASQESTAMKNAGMAPHERPLATGMARGSHAAARDAMATGARAAGQRIPTTPFITPSQDPVEQQRYAQRATEAMALANTQESTATPLDTRMGTARTALVQAIRSGDPTIIDQARELTSGTAYEVSRMDANEPERPAAMREAAIALAIMEPEEQATSTGAASASTAQVGGGALLSNEAGASYRAALGVAQNGNSLIENVRRPEPRLVRSTLQGSSSALSIARFGNSAGHIAESGDHIQRVAAAAMRMDVGDIETPSVQLEVAEALMQASQGYEQAAGLHDTYSSDLQQAASLEESPARQSSLMQQSAAHATSGEQMRTKASTTQVTARDVASTAMTSARIGVAMAGGEARAGRMNAVVHQAGQLLSGGEAAAPTLPPGGDETPLPFLDDQPLLVSSGVTPKPPELPPAPPPVSRA